MPTLEVTNHSKFVEQIPKCNIPTAVSTKACVVIFYSFEKKQKTQLVGTS